MFMLNLCGVTSETSDSSRADEQRGAARLVSAALPTKSVPPTRLKILEGAGEAFGRYGYGETTVDHIIAAAGVSRPSFYKFFRNKDEVFDLLHEMHALALIQMIKGAVIGAGDADAKLERGTEAFLRCIAATGPLAQALYSESRQPGSRRSARYQETVATLTAFFAEQGAALQIDAVDPLVYTGLVAAAEAIGVQIVRGGRMGEAEIQRAKRVILTILHGAFIEGAAAGAER